MPLSAMLRPQKIEEFIGQQHLVGEKGPIRKFIESQNIPSMIFWGPPGTGKTTLAQIISNSVDYDFFKISAVTEGKAILMTILDKAKENKINNKKTLLFIDEIHRWSKSQQDSLLPFIENGDIILIGATTENPSFTVISALLSRSRVFIFKQHNQEDIKIAINKAIIYLSKIKEIILEESLIEILASISDGDIRFAINSLEISASISENGVITKEILENAVQRSLNYDKDGEEHYNIISAVHKSLRSSNASAAIYWITRMLKAGDDPLYIARRLLRFASEDIGNANQNAILLANVVFDTCQKLGMPECETALIQLAEYLAKCKKDNSSYMALNNAKKDIEKYGNLPVPLHLRNASTKLMKELDYGKNYEYDHDLPNKKSTQQCMPDKLKDRNYF